MGLDRRIPTAVLLALVCGSCASARARPALEPRPAGTGQVEVTVTGLGNREGEVLMALFVAPEGWPEDQTRAFETRVLPINGESIVTRFEDVPAGAFAVSVFRDENEDRELDTGLFGIPTEDYGFSRDARGTFGPPSFEDARLELGAGETRQITVQLK